MEAIKEDKGLTEADLDWYADRAVNVIFDQSHAPNPAGRGDIGMVARVQGARLEVIWEARPFCRR